ncbi:TetR family transcriptional regulator [Streptomyces sp. NPDC057307]|uniref:TetR family transcriptional regulator n=1 Tax=Streptomyces sp. NPDC057307 TaxID=3346096 RepID=UPI00363D55EE
MPRNPDATRARIMKAATDEFATYGIAGARMDRVAERAASSKERIYTYFGNKDQLFDAVFSNYVEESLAEVDFDAHDLPAYAGRMFDHFADAPERLRLSTWYRLERPEGTHLRTLIDTNDLRVHRIAAAQDDGSVPSHFTAVQLLAFIQALSTSWATMNPEFSALAAPISRSERRRTVVDAVARVVGATAAPTSGDGGSDG